MKELWFIVKVFLATIVFVLLLQVRFGEQRLESQIEGALHHSVAISYLQQVADGLALVATKSFHGATSWINGKISSAKDRAENQPGQRKFFSKFKRNEGEKE